MKIVRARPHFDDADIRSISSLIEGSLRSGILTMGSIVESFECEFADRIDVKHAIAVNSGTAALEIAMRCIGIDGREVLVPTETFVASANSVLRSGGNPVFVEIDPTTLCIDMADVRAKMSSRTAAIMIVHMGGLVPPCVPELLNLCKERDVALIEDAAHAHGAALNGHAAGSFGVAGCFSFYPTKVITSAEGGMITTDDDDVAAMARSLRNHGANLHGDDYIHVSGNFRMPEPNAAIGLVQMRSLDAHVKRRNEVAAIYTERLVDVEGIDPVPVPSGAHHSFWVYLAMLTEGAERSKLATMLREDFGVPIAWPYDPPCHLQPVFQRILGHARGDLPQSEQALSRHIALPMHVGLSNEQARYVADSVCLSLERVRSRRS